LIWIAQVGTQSLTLSFPPLSDFGTSRACHTLAIVPFFAGDIYGPYLPEGHKKGIGNENTNENGSNELSVPQLLGMSNPTWHYLPDSPASTLPDGRDTLLIGSRVYNLRSGKKVSSSSAKIVSSSASSPIKEETLSSSSLASESGAEPPLLPLLRPAVGHIPRSSLALATAGGSEDDVPHRLPL